MKAYSSYKTSGKEFVSQIPTHWKVMKFKRACDMITDGSHFSPPSQDTGFYYVTVRNIVDGKVDLSDASLISEADFKNLEKTNCRPHVGDILFSKDGTVGKVAIAERDDFVILSSLAILRPSKSISTKYLKYFIESANGKGQIESWFAGAALKRITLDTIINLYSIVPPLPEQQAIADFLDRKTAQIDTLIEKKQRQIDLLHEQRTALINHAVTKGLNPNVKMKDSGVEWLGEIPSHWEVCSLKRLADLKSGDGITSEEIHETGDYAVYGGNGLRGYCSKYTHEGEFVLIGRQGALCGNINYAKGKFWASEHAVVATPKKIYKTIWFGELLRAMNLNQYSLAAAQPGLSVERISNIQLPVPPLEEQKEIENFLVEKFKKIDELIRILNNQIELNKEYRTALISEAVTGKIDVRTVHE